MKQSWNELELAAGVRSTLLRAALAGAVVGLGAHVLVVLLGPAVLAPPGTAAGALAVGLNGVACGLVAIVLARLLTSAGGLPPVLARPVFGVGAAGAGVLLDGLLLLVLGGDYPRLDAAETETLAIALLVGWGCAALGPALDGVRAARATPDARARAATG